MAPLRVPFDYYTDNEDFLNYSTDMPHETRHHGRHRNHTHVRENHTKTHVVDFISSSIMEAMNTRFVPENSVLPDLEPLSTHMDGAMDRHYYFRMNITMNRSDFGADEFVYRHSSAMTAVYCAAYLLVFLVGLIGNCFVIAVVYRSPRMRTVTNFFIVNLAVADILVIVFCLPATLMSNIFVQLLKRSVNEEVITLQRQNQRLQQSIGDLQKQLEELRAQVNGRPVAPTTAMDVQPTTEMEKIIQAVSTVVDDKVREALVSARNMIEARVEGLKTADRPRPSLAADAKKHATPKASSAVPKSAPKSVVKPAAKLASKATKATLKPTPSQKGNGNGKQTLPMEATEPRQSEKATLTSEESEWTSVVKRKKKKTTPKTIASQSQPRTQPIEGKTGQAKARKPKKLRVPRSSAVVLTIGPEAEKRGVSYADVIKRARAAIKLPELGINTPLRIKTTITGAKIFEISGAEQCGKADRLALELATLISNETDVRVHRPQKCAEFVVSGLDDSVNKEEVVEAVAQKGDCTNHSVKTGEIRCGAGGFGTIWVSCPIAAAKKILDAGRLLVGWSSARVRVVETRPIKCFRCLQRGHTRPQCAGEDRTALCFRCGKTDHKMANCTSEPHCVACEAAKLHAGHTLGGKNCKAPVASLTMKKAVAAKTLRATQAANESQPMDTSLPIIDGPTPSQ